VLLLVGNPDLFQADLTAAGIQLPDSVDVQPARPGEELPSTNQGVLEMVLAPDGHTVYFPKQPPTATTMLALLEGTLVESGGCLRVIGTRDDEGLLVLWPYDVMLDAEEEPFEVLNARGGAVARVGDPIRMGGGVMESPASMANYDALIPGMPLEGCPGPYWIAGDIETLQEQSVPDVFVDPFSSGGDILALFISQSRADTGLDTITGRLEIDGDKCMRVGSYTILWPPEVYPRENPLRLVGSDGNILALVGETITITGSAKEPQDYRYFENKVPCPGPYWGASTVSTPE
jgi:hypothetical protein